MKRRNADCGKLRRLPKRSKIAEGFYGSTFLYIKFLMVWALLLMADFILEFRFEYLWPFWLLVRSVYDSFKYQGLAFSVFFVCIAVTSDVICYLFIPVQWLFFAASTYVWVQYVWHTERGICLPTVSLWLLFVYIEVSVRLRELKNLPFNLDLCRPFAAHCIGYPVVTLGFGFKSYISYKMRLRKQKDVQKENDIYFNLIQQALPEELQNQYAEKRKALPSKSEEEVISNGEAGGKKPNKSEEEKDSKKSSSKVTDINEDDEAEYIEQSVPKTPSKADVNSFDESADNFVNNQQVKSFKPSNSVNKTTNNSKLNSSKDNSNKKGKNYSKDVNPATFSNNKDEVISRLESDVKKLKADLQASRNTEQELRSQMNTYITGDKSMRSELYQLQQDNENLQNKLHNLVTGRQQDKQNLSVLEKKMNEERKIRAGIELQLNTERKAKKAEEAAAARAVAIVAARGECTESCKIRQRNIEQLKRDLHVREEQVRQLEYESQSLRQYKEQQNETEVLMSALSAMQDKNTHLENSLSAETRIKLDLFSALGEAKRQIEILKAAVQERDKEISELKSKVTEAMALNMMPTTTAAVNGVSSDMSSSPLYSSKYNNMKDDMIIKSNLNPHASDYTPKTI